MLAPFVGRGDLAFDVGANNGLYTETLLELGAEVIAVEPNPGVAVAPRDTRDHLQLVWLEAHHRERVFRPR